MKISSMVKIICIGLTTILTNQAFADFSADVFEMDSNNQKKIYTLTNKTTEAGGITESLSTYKDLTGAMAVEEKATMKGSALIKYEVEQKQISTKGVVEVKDGKIYFSKTQDGKTKTSDEKLKGDFVISSTLVKFVGEKWKEIMAGETIPIRFAAWERLETVGFEFTKVGEEKIGDIKAVIVRMKPSSFIIASIVNPIFFKFYPDGSKLVEMKGRVAPKKQYGDAWKDLDAEIVYHHN
jgi:hypothetical protein